MNWGWAVAATLASFAISAVGTRAVLVHLRARAILDHPNERSSHATPTPRGGGIAVLAAVLEKHRTRGLLRVTDHKTGKAPEQEPIYVGGGADPS
ncbi:MAG TPA: hypothetical protein VI113_00385, partial [Alphaproteobacteria bacterium]